METTNRTYYLIAPESPVMEAVRTAEVRHLAFVAAVKEFAAKHRANNSVAWGGYRLAGLVFDADSIPAGWRCRQDTCVPDLRTKAGREIDKEIATLPTGIEGFEFSRLLWRAVGGDYTYWGNRRIALSSFRKYGESYILSVPTECKAKPAGCRELKMSEYWKLVEDHTPEAAEAAEVAAG